MTHAVFASRHSTAMVGRKTSGKCGNCRRTLSCLRNERPMQANHQLGPTQDAKSRYGNVLTLVQSDLRVTVRLEAPRLLAV